MPDLFITLLKLYRIKREFKIDIYHLQFILPLVNDISTTPPHTKYLFVLRKAFVLKSVDKPVPLYYTVYRATNIALKIYKFIRSITG